MDDNDIIMRNLSVTPASEPKPKYQPGIFQPFVFDQMEIWVDLHGNEHNVAEMEIDYVKNVIAYLMSHAARLRVAWSIKEEETFDTTIGARRWLLDRPLMLAFQSRIVAAAVEENKRAKEEARQATLVYKSEQDAWSFAPYVSTDTWR